MLGQEVFVRDLTRLAEEGALDRAHGRTREIFAILEILTRRRSKNVLLVGYSGVGKNHIVEGIAVGSVEGEFEEVLPEVRLIEIDYGVLAAGSQELEERLLKLIKYLRNERDTILFVDDVHLVLSDKHPAGGAMDYRKSLRPALLRGGITCIGATTPEYYYELLADNPELHSVFEIVPIEPMTASATFEVLCTLKPQLEAHHRVEITEETLRTCITLTERFLPDKYLPGKAIDVLDQACARYRFKRLARLQNIGLVDDRSWQFNKPYVSFHDLRRVVERITSPQNLLQGFRERWDEREKYLRANVFGQSTAITEVLASLRTAREALADSHRPEFVFLFVGPKGVGKRHLAKNLAHAMFGRDESFFEFDAKTFNEKDFFESISQQMEADSTFGENDSPRIRRLIARCVVFIHSIDEATPGVFECIVPLLKSAIQQRDSNLEVNFKNCIFIFSLDLKTSRTERIGDLSTSRAKIDALRSHLREPFADMLDRIVPFYPLDEDAVRSLIRGLIKRLRSELSKNHVALRIRESAYEFLAAEVTNDGTRMDRLVALFEETVAQPILKMANRRSRSEACIVHVKARDSRIVFQADTRREGLEHDPHFNTRLEFRGDDQAEQ